MDATRLLAELEQLIKAGCEHLSSTIVDAQYDGDNDSASLVVVVEDEDGHQEWIVSSQDWEDLAKEVPIDREA